METKKGITDKMEAPVPIIVKIKEGDNPYTIRFSVESSTLVVNVSEDETVPMINYSFKYSLSDLGKVNRYFRMFESLEELIPELKNLCDEKKVKIQKNKGSVILTLNVPLKNQNEANLTIPQAEMEPKQVIADLCSTVNELKKKIKSMEISYIPEEKLEKNLKSKDIFLDEEEKKMVNNWILKTLKSEQGKKVQMTLLYKLTTHGNNGSTFHSYCNSKGSTLSLIKTTKGYRFGGFTTVSWAGRGSYVNDTNAFIFSLEYKEKYSSNDGVNAIYDNSSYGPTFGSGHDLYIVNGFHSSNSSCNFPCSYYGDRYRGLTGGMSNFRVKDLEVYKIEIA